MNSRKHNPCILVGVSILAADFSCLGSQMRQIKKAGIDFFHVDVMDGHFVPNITIGPGVVKDIRKVTSLPLDVHLMTRRPFEWTDQFVKAGADMITVHIETVNLSRCRKEAKKLKSKGVKFGVSLNPATPLTKIKPVLDCVDFVLIMSVNPGFGGQKFKAAVLSKITALRKIYNGDIAVDGGVNNLTGAQAVAAGANILACGTYIFKASNPKKTILELKKI